eukprot:454588-Rhodomonas_salina.1
MPVSGIARSAMHDVSTGDRIASAEADSAARYDSTGHRIERRARGPIAELTVITAARKLSKPLHGTGLTC